MTSRLPRLAALALLATVLAAAPADAQRRPRRARPAAPVQAPVAAPAETSYYAIETPKGRLVVRLYDDTPLHRDNFRARAAAGLFDSTLFHRVIPGFMAQGGDPNSLDDNPANDGMGEANEATIPAEIKHLHLHGALAAARQGDDANPLRASSPSQFYIVQGRPFGPRELPQMQQRVRAATGDTAFAYSPEVSQRYAAEGGAPFLDGQYTVFGEVVEGLEVLDAIEAVPTTYPDRPTEPIWMIVRPMPAGYAPPVAAQPRAAPAAE